MPITRISKLAVLTALPLAAACFNGGSADPEPEPVSASVAGSRQSDVITQAELDEATSIGNALEVVRRLRPSFLNTRGATSFGLPSGGVLLSIDGNSLIAVGNLSRMRPHELAEIRYLSPSDAAQRFGTAAGTSAVILVKLR